MSRRLGKNQPSWGNLNNVQPNSIPSSSASDKEVMDLFQRGNDIYQRLRSEIVNRGEEIERLKTNSRESTKEIGKLKKDLWECKQAVTELEDCLSKKQEQHREIYNEYQTALENKSCFVGEQAEDGEIQSKFGSIDNDIRSWTFGVVNEREMELSFCPEMLVSYVQVAPCCQSIKDLKKLTKKPENARLFLHGWTAYVLFSALFRNTLKEPYKEAGFDCFLDERERDCYRHLEDTIANSSLSNDVRAFSDWRALTLTLLSSNESSTTKTTNTADRTMKDIEDSILGLLQGSEEDLNDARNELQELIADSLVPLTSELRRQRAIWSIRFPKNLPRDDMHLPLPLPSRGDAKSAIDFPSTAGSSLPFESKTMKDVGKLDEEGDGKKDVGFVLCPALYKRGRSSGTVYNVESIITTAKVVSILRT